MSKIPVSIAIDQSASGKPVRVMHVFGRMLRGGAELRTLDVLHRCPADKIHSEFVALSGKEGTLDEEIRQLGGEVHLLKLDRNFHNRFPVLLRERNIDIVHSHVFHSSGYIVRQAAIAGVRRRIVHYRTDGSAAPKGIWGQAKTYFKKKLIDKYATDILGVSESALASCWAADWKKDARCQVVYNGLDLSKVDSTNRNKQSVCEEFGIDLGQKLLIHIGNFRKMKNHLRLIKIFNAYVQDGNKAHLLLVGGQDATAESIKIYAEIQQEIQKRNLAKQVTLAGTRSDVFQLLAAADLMLFPSQLEGLPGVVLESIASGTPVLSSTLPVIPELQKYFTGLEACDLKCTDLEWSESLKKLLKQFEAQKQRELLQEEFQNSPFLVDQASKRYLGLWTNKNGKKELIQNKIAG